MKVKDIVRGKKDWFYWRNLGLFTLIVVVIAALFLVYVGHPFFLSYGWTHPQRLAVCCATPADFGLVYNEVSFNTSDGLTLWGWWIPSKNRAAVILVHPIASNRVGVLEIAAFLAHNGYGVLLFDLRAHGDSDGNILPFGGPEAEDIVGAVLYLQRRTDIDPNRIGAMGLSLGAQISILGAGRSESIQAVVADGPCCTTFADWPPPRKLSDWIYAPYDLVFFQMLAWRSEISKPVSIQEAIALISPRPILLIGGGAEKNILDHHFQSAGEPKSLWIIAEAGHIDGFSIVPKEYEKRVVDFFDQALLE
jgi:pimeloyl-ACP methyl ester carboxylesterase